MTRPACFIFFSLIFQISIAQQISADSNQLSSAERNLLSIYNSVRQNDLPVFNGTQHYAYSPTIEGIAYFESNAWQKGTVVYDNVMYNNMLMKYDLVTDKLVITPFSGNIFISLFSPRISEFSFSGHKFIRLEKNEKTDPPTGFYYVMADGKVKLLSKTTKTISEKIVDNALFRKFEEVTKYYILKDGFYYEISSKNALLNVLKEKRKEVQNLISLKKLKYRRDAQTMILSAVQLYNQ